MNDLDNLLVHSGQGNYPVEFFVNIEELIASKSEHSDEVFIVIDEHVLDLYPVLSSFYPKSPIYTVVASEATKTLQGVEELSSWLISVSATRSSRIIAIGGGVVQDLVTFTAHVYYRGISWEFIPTTLLSQSDSCIGAKCGINVAPFKNQIGVFHSPSKVSIVSEFLNTLSEIDLESGFGEIFKLSVTGHDEFFDALKHFLLLPRRTNNELLNLLHLSLKAKKSVIEEDEYENDLRRILNYGHSFGHALESLTNYAVSHGHGVFFWNGHYQLSWSPMGDFR